MTVNSLRTDATYFRICVVVVLLSIWTSNLPLFGAATSSTTALDDGDFVIAGYLPDYRPVGHLNVTAGRYLTDLLLFSLEVPGAGPKLDATTLQDLCCVQSHQVEAARHAQLYAKEDTARSTPLRVWLTVGGGGRTEHFFSMVAGSGEAGKVNERSLAFIQAIGEWRCVPSVDRR